MDAVVQFSQVTKRFAGEAALDDVTFAVPRGTIFALLGENGAGKTTALRLMLGLIEPSAGETRVFGLDPLVSAREIRRRVGYLPEQPALYDWMTVAEIGRFTAAFYEQVPFSENYRRLADELSLPGARRIKALSKGGRAKVALALALAQDPELLVLDEPTSGLDLLVRHEILDRLVDLAAAGRTVLLSSHQIAEVERVAETVAIVHHGRLVALESIEQLKAQTREITLTTTGSAPPAIAGEILRSRQQARQWQILVRGCDAAEITQLEGNSEITSVSVRTPRLEEIVAGYLMRPQGNGDASQPEAPRQFYHDLRS